MHQQSDLRSSMAATCRKECLTIFKPFKIPDSCWQRPSDRAEDMSCLALISWNPGNKPVKYDMYPPIIYEDVCNKRSEMFMQPILIKVCNLLPHFARTLAKFLIPSLHGSFSLDRRHYTIRSLQLTARV